MSMHIWYRLILQYTSLTKQGDFGDGRLLMLTTFRSLGLTLLLPRHWKRCDVRSVLDLKKEESIFVARYTSRVSMMTMTAECSRSGHLGLAEVF